MHPAKRSRSNTAKFRFRTNPPTRARFECRLDARRFARCHSPRTYRHLKRGKHTFRVRAIGPTGLRAKPTIFKFTVLP